MSDETPPQQPESDPQNSPPNPVTNLASIEPLIAALQAAQTPSPYLSPASLGVNPTSPGLLLGQASMHLWQGQFPPPDAVESYERILPGCFDRIIKMAEKQQDIQAKQVSDALKFASNDTKRGNWLGFSGLVLAMILAFVCFWKGEVAGGLAFLSVPVFTTIKALIDSAKRPSPTGIAKAIADSQANTPSGSST
jgi:uncharacterized membrane protein